MLCRIRSYHAGFGIALQSRSSLQLPSRTLCTWSRSQDSHEPSRCFTLQQMKPFQAELSCHLKQQQQEPQTLPQHRRRVSCPKGPLQLLGGCKGPKCVAEPRQETRSEVMLRF